MKWLMTIISLLVSFTGAAAQLEVQIDQQAPIHLTQADITSNLATTQFTTSLPWLKKPSEFTGFKVSELLKHLNANEVKSVSFVALNDYSSSTKIEDIIKYQPIVAYKVDGKTLKIRDKGPYWLVFNLDENPEIKTDKYFGKMVWQIKQITINSK